MKTAFSSVMRVPVLALALSLVLSLIVGGCGPRYQVVKQANPNPMTGTSSFRVEKAVFDPNFHVGNKTEQEWLAEAKAEKKDNWDGDKVAMAEKFTDGFVGEREKLVMAATSGAGIFSVRARFVQYDPGYYAVVSSAPATLEADIDFLDGSGAVLDTIRVRSRQSGFSAGEGARRCAQEIGAISAKYLKKRVGLD
jgi:hypothetical protein